MPSVLQPITEARPKRLEGKAASGACRLPNIAVSAHVFYRDPVGAAEAGAQFYQRLYLRRRWPHRALRSRGVIRAVEVAHEADAQGVLVHGPGVRAYALFGPPCLDRAIGQNHIVIANVVYFPLMHNTEPAAGVHGINRCRIHRPPVDTRRAGRVMDDDAFGPPREEKAQRIRLPEKPDPDRHQEQDTQPGHASAP